MAADSLVERHQAMPPGGWAWRSSIQAPHHQTDRDVGAASIGEGLLAAYAVTRDARYRRAAVAAGDYLLGVAEPAAGGLRWPDWADPDGERSTTHFTSFDDGAAGISDYLWEAVPGHARAPVPVGRPGRHALGGVARRVLAERLRLGVDRRPVMVGRLPRGRHGRGRHRPRARRLRRPHRRPPFRSHARAGAARLRRLTAHGARPLPRGSEDPTAETGFLSGSAGAAFMFLDRFARDRDPADLATAHRLLRWVNAQALADGLGGLHWPISRGSEAIPAGFELGAAGIAWVNLRAPRATGERAYRASRPPGRRLVPVRGDRGLGLGRAPGRSHGSRANRARQRHGGESAGCWRTSRARASRRPRTTGRRERRWPASEPPPSRDRLGAFWYANRLGGVRRLRAEPSWHWGAAGDRGLRRAARRLVRPRSGRTACTVVCAHPPGVGDALAGWLTVCMTTVSRFTSVSPRCDRRRGAEADRGVHRRPRAVGGGARRRGLADPLHLCDPDPARIARGRRLFVLSPPSCSACSPAGTPEGRSAGMPTGGLRPC